MALPDGASSDNMGIKDEIFYTTFSAPVECFPRIKYFQSRLKDLYPRFERLHNQIPGSLKPPGAELNSLNDAINQLTDSIPVVHLFGPAHSKIPKTELIPKVGDMRRETHQLDDVPHLGAIEKKHKLFVVICTIRMIETQQGKNTLQQLKDGVGVENMLFFVDAEYESNKNLADTNIQCIRGLMRHKITIVYQSEKKLSTAISDHIERKFIDAFHLMNQYLQEFAKKTAHSREWIFGQEDTKKQIASAISKFFRTPLTILDLFLTTEQSSAERKIAIATVKISKDMIIKDIVKGYKLQVSRASDYLDEVRFNEECITLLEKNDIASRALSKAPLIKKLLEIAEKQKERTSVVTLRCNYALVEILCNLYGTQSGKATKRGLHREFLRFSDAIAVEAANALWDFFLDIGSRIRNIMNKIDLLARVQKELLRIMEKTIEKQKYSEVMPKLQNWRDHLERIKEVKAVGHICGQLSVFVQKPESAERASEIQKKIEKCLLDYPGEILVVFNSGCLYGGGGSPTTTNLIAMGDAFLCNSRRGTIGLFMNKMDEGHNSLLFLTSSHVVLESEKVTTAETTPVPLGERTVFLTAEDNLLDIAVIQVHPEITKRCNPFFPDDSEPHNCMILDMDGISKLDEFEQVFKIGSTSGLTQGCILSKDLKLPGLSNHTFVIGVPPGSDDAIVERGFAQKGDSGAVVYTEPAPNEIHYISIVMGEYSSDELGGESKFEDLKQSHGPLVMTSCVREGLKQLEEDLACVLTLPHPEQNQSEEENPNVL
ncbi:hypothetical protein ACJMK2_011136 [Sinanodonta woodiana]|uniref:Uncharacterized protein n=1 Tax=Sinanodonta woodiana TaxID=1069815 RepID=A0ABD3V6J2_SINWO